MYGRITLVLTACSLSLFAGVPVAADLEKVDPFDLTFQKAAAAGQESQNTVDEQALKNATPPLKTDGPALLEFFRKGTLGDKERAHYQAVIRKLGSPIYREREQAMAELASAGAVLLHMLREASDNADLEISRRAEKCIQRIQEKAYGPEVPAAAARLVAVRKPEGAIETLLAYLPFADNDNVADEVRITLSKLAVTDGQASHELVKALSAKDPIRRAAAGEALCRADVKDQRKAVRRLLEDADAFVRLRVALALAHTKEKEAVPVLIDLLPQLTLTQAWQAEDVLLRLAEGKNPPAVSLGRDEEARKKCRDAWHAWWKTNAAAVDLARLSETPPLLGYTLIVLLDMGRVVELGPDNQPRWAIDGLVFPLDAQVLPGDRVLVAEYHASRVTERNTKGDVLWQKRVGGPLAAQRLANGNTFIVTDTQLLEVDRDDKEVLSINMPGGDRIMKAMKLPNGEIACLTADARILRLDTAGKVLYSFEVSLGTRLFGGRLHMLSNGRVLVPHNAENKVVEYDAQGKATWEVVVEAPIAAMRLPNGNTLVTTMLPNVGAVEFDRNGREVWHYRTNTRVTRALRR